MPCYKTLQQGCWLHGKLPVSMQGEVGSPFSLQWPAVGGRSRGSLKDTEILLMWSGQCWRDLTAHTAIASQSRIPQEIPVLWNICQASSTPRVIGSLRGWKGQMCLWCNCSEASRDLSGTQSPGWCVTALPHSAAGANPAQSSECLLLNRPNRHFWTEIRVCLGTEGWHLGFPLFPFRHFPSNPGVLPLARWAGRGSALPGAALGEDPSSGFGFVWTGAVNFWTP